MIAEKGKWILLDVKDSRFHIYGEEGLFNTKFVSSGEDKYEAVYNKNGLLLTEKNDPINMGTYNYCGVKTNLILHALLDVMTYNKWGNVEGKPYNEKPRSMDDFNANQEAQDAYNKIKEQMESN